ncbi:hypothetical protein [Enterocloster sp.]|uniref:hypothetical protein n=1 Tax=Enterocloster sp. TaxID=2719315 RepID=UPI0039A3F013
MFGYDQQVEKDCRIDTKHGPGRGAGSAPYGSLHAMLACGDKILVHKRHFTSFGCWG